MIELLIRLIFGHVHKWDRKEDIMVQSDYDKDFVGKIIISQCSVCGKIKQHRVKW